MIIITKDYKILYIMQNKTKHLFFFVNLKLSDLKLQHKLGIGNPRIIFDFFFWNGTRSGPSPDLGLYLKGPRASVVPIRVTCTQLQNPRSSVSVEDLTYEILNLGTRYSDRGLWNSWDMWPCSKPREFIRIRGWKPRASAEIPGRGLGPKGTWGPCWAVWTKTKFEE